MGNSQSNSIDQAVNKILEENSTTSEKPASEIKLNVQKTDDVNKKYVNSETDMRRSPRRRSPRKSSPGSAKRSPRRSPRRRSPRRSPSPNLSVTSSAVVPNNISYSPTSDVQTEVSVVKMSPSLEKKPDVVFNNEQKVISLQNELATSPEAPLTGGYSYSNEVSEQNVGYLATDHISMTGGDNHGHVISLDPAIFESSEMFGGEEEKKNSSEFNPEKFFQDMKKGGVRGSKEHKKNRIDKMFDSNDDDDDGFDFDEATEGLDVDPREDTEDLKHKVKVLRAMVSRTKANKKGKKSSKKGSKKGSKKSKRTTESSVGGSDNSVSEYLDSTSSINTSDVRLISMNKMRK